jgi:hypothetical protein
MPMFSYVFPRLTTILSSNYDSTKNLTHFSVDSYSSYPKFHQTSHGTINYTDDGAVVKYFTIDYNFNYKIGDIIKY